MERQELFNKAYLGVIKQGKQSVSISSSNCVYYNEIDNLRCNIGQLLPDKENKKLDFLGGLVKVKDRFLPDWIIKDKVFYIGLQRVHDTASKDYFIEDFKNKMELFAIKHKLDIPE